MVRLAKEWWRFRSNISWSQLFFLVPAPFVMSPNSRITQHSCCCSPWQPHANEPYSFPPEGKSTASPCTAAEHSESHSRSTVSAFTYSRLSSRRPGVLLSETAPRLIVSNTQFLPEIGYTTSYPTADKVLHEVKDVMSLVPGQSSSKRSGDVCADHQEG